MSAWTIQAIQVTICLILGAITGWAEFRARRAEAAARQRAAALAAVIALLERKGWVVEIDGNPMVAKSSGRIRTNTKRDAEEKRLQEWW